MRPGRRFILPVDPWPVSTWAERLAATFVVVLLLTLPVVAVGVAGAIVTIAVLHASRSYDLGAAIRGLIDRDRRGTRGPRGGRSGGVEPHRIGRGR